MKRKNVLIIYTDQQRVDSLGCYGNTKAITPNIDQLAREGALLKNYFVQNPVCMASRMSFLTGRYPANLGIGCNGTPLDENFVTINQLFKPYGYHCGNIGKLHFQPHARRDYRNPHPSYGFDTLILSDEPGCYDDAYSKWAQLKGFDMEEVRTSLPPEASGYGKPEYSKALRETHQPYILKSEDLTHSAFVVDEVSTFIDNHKNENFFLIAGFYAPHTPVNPPQRFYDMYEGVDFDLPILGENEIYDDMLKNVSKDKWKDIIKHYMALSSHVDDCVGQIIKKLKEDNIYDDTIIVFTSDHGEYLGDHGRIQKGMPGHDCIINVPCILKNHQEVQTGIIADSLVEAIDIAPTLLDWVGIQKPDFLQGKSLHPYLSNLSQNNHLVTKQEFDTSPNTTTHSISVTHKESILVDYFEPVFYQEGKTIVRSSSIRTEQYKYNVSEGEEILYDLEADPNELKNVASDDKYQQILSNMRFKLIGKLQEAGYVNRHRPEKY